MTFSKGVYVQLIMFCINESGDYREIQHSLAIKPDSPYMAYGRAKIRAQSIKAITPEKLKKRFIKLSQFINANKEFMTEEHRKVLEA